MNELWQFLGLLSYIQMQIQLYQQAPIGTQLVLDTPDLVIRVGGRRVRISSLNTVVE